MATIIELKNITKKFAGVTALNDVSLSVEKGEVVGLIGDNGAGKSTLIKTLVGVHSPDKGSIEIQGKLVEKWNALKACLLYTSPSPRDQRGSRMPASA